MSSIDRYYCMPMPRDPTATDDIHMGCHTGTRWVNTVTKRAFICTDPSLSAAIWHQTTVPSAFYETITANLTTASTTYQFVQSFPFIGSSTAVLQSVSVVAVQSGGGFGVNFDVRVRDVTNNTVICEATGLRSLTKTIFPLGTLSNLPSSEAVFDIEIRRSGTVTADTATIFCFIMKYY